MGGLKGVMAIFFVAVLINFLDGLGDAERLGVKGGLGDEAVWEGQAEDASNAGGEAKEEEVPVEYGWLSERELAALGDEGGD